MPKKHNSLTLEKKHDSKKGGGGYPSGGGDYPSGGGDYPSGGGDYPSGGGGQGQGCMALKSKKKCLKVKLLHGRGIQGVGRGQGGGGCMHGRWRTLSFGWGGGNSPVVAILGVVVVRVKAAWLSTARRSASSFLGLPCFESVNRQVHPPPSQSPIPKHNNVQL